VPFQVTSALSMRLSLRLMTGVTVFFACFGAKYRDNIRDSIARLRVTDRTPSTVRELPGVVIMRLRRLLANGLGFLPSPNRQKLGLVTVLIACAGLPVYSAAQQKVSIQQTPLAVREGTAQLIGHYDSAQMLRLVFALKPPHLEEEEQLLKQLQDRDSPLFHKYLSEQEWNERFAPSAQDEQAVAAWAQSQGLTITQRYPNRLLVDVEAPAGVIEKALDVAINRYQKGSATYFSNDRDPAIPAQFAGIVHAVLGLNNFEVMHTFSKGSQNFAGPDYSPGPAYAVGSHLVSDAGKKSRAATSARGKQPGWIYGDYWPSDLYAPGGYDYGGPTYPRYEGGLSSVGHCCNPLNNPNNSPPEASIAIAIWGDFSDSDLNLFIEAYLPGAPSNLQRYFVDGRPTCCSSETTLDVEWSTAMSNSFSSPANTAEIHLYEGTNGQVSTLVDVVNRALSDGHARVLNMSWGGAEFYDNPAAAMNTFHAIFNQMNGQGWTLVAASGDGGATTDCADHLSVSYPASDPDVTAAGGTTLEGGGISGFVSETGWTGGTYGCSYNDGGSGGGCSAYFQAPGYQSNPACGANSRSLPDLALNADGDNTPQYFCFNQTCSETGGTSIASPEIAGFYAQTNAYLLYIGSIVGNTCGASDSAPCAPLGNANWFLYEEGYQPSAPHYPFYDITSGCNNNDITQRYGLTPFCAGPGYDMVTGWGSANMLQLAWMMNAFVAGDGAGPTATFSGAQRDHWYNTDQPINWTVTDIGVNGHLPNGVSGYSYYWDLDPGDPYSEATPFTQSLWYTPNSFYYGPLYPNNSNGQVGLSSMPSGQGCHTLLVRAWDNAGQTQVSWDGPLCYDNVPPVTTITLTGNGQGTRYTGPVLVTLSATDNASGVASTLYYLDQAPLQTYSGPFFVYVPGYHCVQAYSLDVAGNVENWELACMFIDSNQQFTLSVSKAGTGSGTVTSADGNINCGSTCASLYWDGQPVTLTASPAAGSVFAGWRNCDLSFGFSCTLTVLADRTATAIFNVPVALQFVPVAPCRLVDTRPDRGGSGPIQGGTSQTFNLPQLAQSANPECANLSAAAAYSLNVSAVPQGPLGYLTVWPDGLTRPLTATLNSLDGRIKANASTVAAGDNQSIDIYVTHTSDVVLDINGYYVPAPAASALAFYPLTPCRVIDTRKPDSDLGGPYLPGNQERDFPVLEATGCNIPSSAQAYSMNFAVVPTQALGYLTVWATGQARPVVSTLNDLTGTIVANAAIVPAGADGSIAVYPSNDTELVVDIDGYFAPPAAGGLSLYTFAACRVIDTRKVGSGLPFSGTLSPPIEVLGGACAPSPQAQAYVFNATLVPTGGLGYLTLWPDGTGQPLVSTLNAIDGAITSNMAIVPTTNGSVDAYASGITQLILDISSYFAP
jgi:Pro-kumamolisin, activation domain/Subtilase family/Divergent InlB B-repeat domain